MSAPSPYARDARKRAACYGYSPASVLTHARGSRASGIRGDGEDGTYYTTISAIIIG